MPKPTDRELVDALLDATVDVSPEDLERETGIQRTTLERFHRGHHAPDGWKKLGAVTRRRLVAYLTRINRLPENLS